MRATLRTAAAALAGAALLFTAAPLHAADADLLAVGSPAPAWTSRRTPGRSGDCFRAGSPTSCTRTG